MRSLLDVGADGFGFTWDGTASFVRYCGSPKAIPGRRTAPWTDYPSFRPWIDGEVLGRAGLTGDQMQHLSRTLGACHQALTALPPADDFPCTTGLPGIADQLDELAAGIRARSNHRAPEDDDLEVIDRRSVRLRETGDVASLLAQCSVQVVHGDYYLDNVLFHGDGSLAAIIDVEGWTTARVREVYQAIAWSQRS